MTKTVGFLTSNCLKCTNACLDVIWTYRALCLIDFLAGDYSKCMHIFRIIIEICFTACKGACIVLYT